MKYNQLPKKIKVEYDVKYSELKGELITIYQTNTDNWGALDKEYNSIVKPLFDSIEYQLKRSIFICVNYNRDKADNGKDYFLLNQHGELINEQRNLNYVNTRTENQFPYRNSQSDKWGLLNESFEIIIEPIYDRIISFAKNVNLVELHNKYGLVNNKAKAITDLKYDDILINNENPNKLIALENSVYKVISAYNNEEEILDYSHIIKGNCNSYGGRINQYSNHLKTIVNGKRIQNEIESIDDLTMYEGVWGIIDINGSKIISPKYCYIDFFNESKNFKVLIGNIKFNYDESYKLNISGFNCGVISDKQKILIEAKYTWIDEISPSLFKVNLGGKVFYNDDYQENYWMALGGKWGIINDCGEVIIPIEYDNIMTNWFRVKDLIIVQNGDTIFNPNMEYEAYELNGKKVNRREVNYLEHMYSK